MPGGDDFQKVQVGDPPGIPVRVWNAMLDVVRPNFGAPPRAFAQRLLNLDGSVILVQNNSGADRGLFDVLGLASPVIDHGAGSAALNEFARQVFLSGVTPDEDNVDRFGILLDPLAGGAVGRLLVSGAGIARVNVTPATQDFQFARAKVGDCSVLELAESGSAQVLWRASNNLGAYCIVRLAIPQGGGCVFFGGRVADIDGYNVANDQGLIHVSGMEDAPGCLRWEDLGTCDAGSGVDLLTSNNNWIGTNAFAALLSAGGAFALAGDLAPPMLTADTHDYHPPGL